MSLLALLLAPSYAPVRPPADRVALALSAALVLTLAGPVAAETATRVDSCSEAAMKIHYYGLPSQDISWCADFESGSLTNTTFFQPTFPIGGPSYPYFSGDWLCYLCPTGYRFPITPPAGGTYTVQYGETHTAFLGAPGSLVRRQPNYGDNVRTTRIAWPSLQARLDTVGGDYWNTPHPIGHQGRYWIGTYENRPGPTASWRTTQGDKPQGSIYGPAFTANRKYVTFLIGGGCDRPNVHVKLQKCDGGCEQWGASVDPIKASPWSDAREAAGPNAPLLKKQPPCQAVPLGNPNELVSREGMIRQFWDVEHLAGKQLRFVIVDQHSGGWGHINVDHILHTNKPPEDLNAANQPVWGSAELHAHPVNEVSNRSLGGQAGDGQLMWGSGMNDTGSQSALPACNGTHHGLKTPGAGKLIAAMEQASLGATSVNRHAMYDAASPNANQTGPNGRSWSAGDFAHWPAWWDRIHQTMPKAAVKRAYDGGLRLMVAAVGNTEVLGFAMGYSQKQSTPFLSDHGAIRRSVQAIDTMIANNASWMEEALTPGHARDIIRRNKLAIVKGLELDTMGQGCKLPFTQANDDGSVSSTSGGVNLYHIKRSNLQECATEQDWADHLDMLYLKGIRHVIPIHMADNNLGGSAIYTELASINNYFLRGTHYGVTHDSSLKFFLTPYQAKPAWCETGAACGWASEQTASDVIVWVMKRALANFVPDMTTFTLLPHYKSSYHIDFTSTPLSYDGHRNIQGLTTLGRKVIQQMRDRGMIIDIDHASQKVKDEVLGINGFSSPVPGVPVVASHTGPRALAWGRTQSSSMGKWANENHLRDDQINAIRIRGGMIGVGVGQGDVKGYSSTGAPNGELYSSTVENDCAGSSKTFAQNYLHVLKQMQGRGVAFGTDLNGFNGSSNPRFGRDGCFAAGGFSRQASSTLGHHDNRSEHVHKLLGFADYHRYQQVKNSKLTRYKDMPTSMPLPVSDYMKGTSDCNFSTVAPPVNEHGEDGKHNGSCNFHTEIRFATPSSLPPLSRHGDSPWGKRTWDINTDGVAHYGMLPDFFQDLRTVGMTQEQLGSIFNSAESYIQMWEKACSFAANPSSCSGG